MSMFQQRHYEAIAQVLKDERKEVYNLAGLDLVIERLAEMFDADNPKFKRDVFLLAADHGPSREKMDAIVKQLMGEES